MVAVLGCKAAFMLHACGVLARRRERGASNVLTTPPTPCMLGGHDGDSMREGAGAKEPSGVHAYAEESRPTTS